MPCCCVQSVSVTWTLSWKLVLSQMSCGSSMVQTTLSVMLMGCDGTRLAELLGGRRCLVTDGQFHPRSRKRTIRGVTEASRAASDACVGSRRRRPTSPSLSWAIANLSPAAAKRCRAIKRISCTHRQTTTEAVDAAAPANAAVKPDSSP